MANIQNKKTANIFQDELEMMFDGMNMDNYADDLNDGDDFDRLLFDAPTVKSVPSSKSADTERPVPKLVNVNSRVEKNPDIDALLDAVDDSDSLLSDAHSIAVSKALDIDDLDQDDDFEAFDEFGEIGGFESAKNALNSHDEASVVNAGHPGSLVELEENFGVQFNTLQDDFEDFDTVNEATAASSEAPQHTLSEVQSKLDQYLKLAADKATVQQVDAAVSAGVSETEAAAKANTMLDYGVSADEFQVIADDTENALNKQVAAVSDVEITDIVEKHNVADINASKEMEAPKSFADFLDISEDDYELSASKMDAQSVVATLHLQDQHLQNGGFSEISDFDDDIAMPVVTGNTEAVSELVSVESKSEIDPDPAFMAKISELWVAHNLIKQQVSDFTQLKNNVDQLDKIVQLEAKERKERKDFKKPLDLNEHAAPKVPSLVYMAAGIGGLSLLISGGLLAYSMVVTSDVNDLKAQIVALKTDLAVLKQGNIAAAPAVKGPESNAAAQVAARVKILGAKAPSVDSSTEDFTQELEKQAKPLPIKALSVNALQDAQIKPDQAIKVIAANNKNLATSSKTASQSSTQWVANLMSFKQDWYAKGKVAEFAKHGVNVLVVPVDVKGETWYILRSAGFAKQEQAVDFAEKAKKSLNLTSILVTQNE
ncbi:MAG: hypothetical protein HOP02_05010 [Methylococcaceae bacterium]|nr:hypothetical protein [Methylococcaceae bacterium]